MVTQSRLKASRLDSYRCSCLVVFLVDPVWDELLFGCKNVSKFWVTSTWVHTSCVHQVIPAREGSSFFLRTMRARMEGLKWTGGYKQIIRDGKPNKLKVYHPIPDGGLDGLMPPTNHPLQSPMICPVLEIQRHVYLIRSTTLMKNIFMPGECLTENAISLWNRILYPFQRNVPLSEHKALFLATVEAVDRFLQRSDAEVDESSH
jgi:hypothetical protein